MAEWTPEVPPAADIERLRAKISEDLVDAERVVRLYYTDAGFAGRLFDRQGRTPGDEALITEADLLAVAMLDAPFKPAAARLLLGDPPAAVRDFLALSEAQTLWMASDADLLVANRAWDELMDLDDVGETRVSKLMARKRPHMVPITDSVVRQRLSPRTDPLTCDLWVGLRSVLTPGVEPGIHERLLEIQESTACTDVSILRILDVVIWMRHRGRVQSGDQG
jgi:hypothetical protein